MAGISALTVTSVPYTSPSSQTTDVATEVTGMTTIEPNLTATTESYNITEAPVTLDPVAIRE